MQDLFRWRAHRGKKEMSTDDRPLPPSAVHRGVNPTLDELVHQLVIEICKHSLSVPNPSHMMSFLFMNINFLTLEVIQELIVKTRTYQVEYADKLGLK